VPARAIFAGGNPGRAGAVIFPGANGAPNDSVTYNFKYSPGSPPTITLLLQPQGAISNLTTTTAQAPVSSKPATAC
jgi:hypothetical protein